MSLNSSFFIFLSFLPILEAGFFIPFAWYKRRSSPSDSFTQGQSFVSGFIFFMFLSNIMKDWELFFLGFLFKFFIFSSITQDWGILFDDFPVFIVVLSGGSSLLIPGFGQYGTKWGHDGKIMILFLLLPIWRFGPERHNINILIKQRWMILYIYDDAFVLIIMSDMISLEELVLCLNNLLKPLMGRRPLDLG